MGLRLRQGHPRTLFLQYGVGLFQSTIPWPVELLGQKSGALTGSWAWAHGADTKVPELASKPSFRDPPVSIQVAGLHGKHFYPLAVSTV